MNNLWYSFRELKKSLFLKLIIIVQISLAIILIYRALEMKNYEEKKSNSMNLITKDKRIYSITSMYNDMDIFFKDQQDPNKFSKFSKEIQEKYTIVSTTYGEVMLKDFPNIYSFVDSDIKTSEKDEGYKPVNSLQCSFNFFKVFNIRLSEGNFNDFNDFTQMKYDEWNGRNIPIILGNSYKGIFKLDDIIESKNLKYKVIGFLEENQFYLDKGIYQLNRVKNLNTVAIRPSSKDIIDYNINNSFLVMNKLNLDNFNLIKNDIENLSKRYNVKLSVFDPADDVKRFVETISYDVNMKILIVDIVMIFVIMGLIVIFLNRTILRKKEFSLHIMHGATFKDIYVRVILENIYLVILSVIMALPYLIKNNTRVFKEVIKFDIKIFVISSLVMFGIVFVIAVICIYNIKKQKLNYLIRGE